MKINPKIYGISAAVLFGASAPFSKVLLNNLTPLQLAGLLYLGSGLSLLLVKFIQLSFNQLSFNKTKKPSHFTKTDIAWLLGSLVSGGVLAPIALLFGILKTPAATASMLLNFESVATAFVAFLFFREHIGKRIGAAIAIITIAGIILSLDLPGHFGISWGALLILSACILWGIDNNFTRNISGKDPVILVIIKGMGAGIFSFLLSLVVGNGFPTLSNLLWGLMLGAFSYGASLLLFINALRDLGSARASALFASAPFIGASISFLIFFVTPSMQFLGAVAFMILGTYLLFKESHIHQHEHANTDHDHVHTHNDGHHQHSHEYEKVPKMHRHPHHHESIVHSHDHTPDLHHRHTHG